MHVRFARINRKYNDKEQTPLAYRIILKIIPQLGLLELVLLAGVIAKLF